MAEPSTEPPTEPPTKPPTETPTKPPTEPPTKPSTEPPTQAPTQPPTGPIMCQSSKECPEDERCINGYCSIPPGIYVIYFSIWHSLTERSKHCWRL